MKLPNDPRLPIMGGPDYDRSLYSRLYALFREIAQASNGHDETLAAVEKAIGDVQTELGDVLTKSGNLADVADPAQALLNLGAASDADLQTTISDLQTTNANVQTVSDDLQATSSDLQALEALVDSGNVGVGSTGFVTRSYASPARVLNVTYTNTTGAPMFLFVVGESGTTALRLNINGSGAAIVRSSGYVSVAGLIPAGATYLIDFVTGTVATAGWREISK